MNTAQAKKAIKSARIILISGTCSSVYLPISKTKALNVISQMERDDDGMFCDSWGASTIYLSSENDLIIKI